MNLPSISGILTLLIAPLVSRGEDVPGDTRPQQPALALSPDSPAGPIPLRWAGGWLLVPVKINGVDAGWFKIGTGWRLSAIDSKVAARLKLPETPQYGLLQDSLKSQAGVGVCYRVDNFQCGGVRVEDLWLAQMDFTGMSQEVVKMHGEGLSGVIGWDLLRSIPFTIDYGTLELSWHPKAAPSAEVHRNPLLPGRPVPMIEVQIGEGQRATAVINTANASAASLRREFVQQQVEKIWAGRQATGETTQFGVTDDDDQLGVANSMKGRNDRRWVRLAAFNTNSTVLGMLSTYKDREHGDLQIGYGFLRSFKLTFDGPSGALWSEPANAAPETIAIVRPKTEGTDYLRFQALIAASESDDAAAVRAMIARGHAVEWPGQGDHSPLAHACRSSARAAALALLEAGAKVEDSGVRIATTPLIESASAGDAVLVERLLKAGAQPSLLARNGYSPLMAAARSGNEAVATALLAKASFPSDSNQLLNIAVDACFGGNVPLAQKLWPRITPDQMRGMLADEALSGASMSGQIPTVTWLLAKGGASISRPTRAVHPLLAAILPGRVEKTDAVRQKLVSLLLSKGADPNISKNGVTPLLLAARHGDVEIIKLLLAAGAKAEATDFKGRNAVHRAAEANQPAELLALLLKAGLKINRPDSVTDRTPLGSYASHGNAAACQALLDAGADPNMSTFTSPALTLVTNGADSTDDEALTVTNLLLKHGARPTTSMGNQAGPMVGAIAQARSSLIEPLVQSSGGINEKLFVGVTPLLLASAISNRATVAKLLELGADPRWVDDNRSSAAAHAAAAGRLQNLALLIEKGASVNAENASSTPPLCAAASTGQLGAVKFLLTAKADLNAKDPKTGDTAGSIANRRGDDAMLDVLRGGGARNE